MPMSPYLAAIRDRIGHAVLLMPTVSAAIFDDEGRLLLARHADGGRWAPVGGIVDLDEDPAAAVVREVLEETGLVAELTGIVGSYGGPECRMVYSNGDEIAFVATVYGCRVESGPVMLDASEVVELGWFAERAAMELSRLPWTERALPDAFAWQRRRALRG